jgi:predicted nucleic acid-binding protein
MIDCMIAAAAIDGGAPLLEHDRDLAALAGVGRADPRPELRSEVR